MDSLIGLLVVAAVPAYPFLQVSALKRLRGGWWYAAAIPMLVMIPILALTAVAFARQSNLWPLALIFGSLLACIYLAATLALHRYLNR
ncbi:MAG: hypothetical protein R3D44_12905 [Hyphomicrobiaceae bacterium]